MRLIFLSSLLFLSVYSLHAATGELSAMNTIKAMAGTYVLDSKNKVDVVLEKNIQNKLSYISIEGSLTGEYESFWYEVEVEDAVNQIREDGFLEFSQESDFRTLYIEISQKSNQYVLNVYQDLVGEISYSDFDGLESAVEEFYSSAEGAKELLDFFNKSCQDRFGATASFLGGNPHNDRIECEYVVDLDFMKTNL